MNNFLPERAMLWLCGGIVRVGVAVAVQQAEHALPMPWLYGVGSERERCLLRSRSEPAPYKCPERRVERLCQRAVFRMLNGLFSTLWERKT